MNSKYSGYVLIVAIFYSCRLMAQEIKAEDRGAIEDLKSTVNYLANDKLEGRRMGTPGEKLAYEFISDKFKKSGLIPYGKDQSFIQKFEVRDGREIKKETSLLVDSKPINQPSDFFPMAYSANVSNLTFAVGSDSAIRYYDLKSVLDENKTNPHFDLKGNIFSAAQKAGEDKKRLFVIHGAFPATNEVVFDAKDRSTSLNIPVIYLKDKSTFTKNILLNIAIAEKMKNGHNVIGYINNNATSTIILGAHYDHLGYGEDHNSLYSGSTPMIHNGADDNASGIAGLIALGAWVKNSGLKKYNYALIAFSGEELGLYGSKYFCEHPPFDLKSVNYMINMDMIGRLNDSTHGLTIGGYGTSPVWGELISKENKDFKVKLDSSGTGPSDHTSFYRKDIPVLFFFTGAHSDYHKPSDDADKINFSGQQAIVNYIKSILKATDKKEKLPFLKTREITMGKSSFKVTLGIMPDYSFEGKGVRVDGVSENRPAQKAGMKAGDVIYQLGEHVINDVESYMKALNKFNKGDATKAKLLRGKEELELDIVF